jgi:hypothetical protein
MSTTLITILCAAVLVALAMLALSIGLILTGKTRIRAGACKTTPCKTRQQDDHDQETSCSVCHNKPLK